MKTLMFGNAGRRALVVAFAAVAPLAMGQMYGTSAGANPGGDNIGIEHDSAAMEAGTIPAAPAGLPQVTPRGAQGPLRADSQGDARTDPSIRDTNPLTVNGLWEMLPGNRIASPGTQ